MMRTALRLHELIAHTIYVVFNDKMYQSLQRARRYCINNVLYLIFLMVADRVSRHDPDFGKTCPIRQRYLRFPHNAMW